MVKDDNFGSEDPDEERAADPWEIRKWGASRIRLAYEQLGLKTVSQVVQIMDASQNQISMG